MDSNGTLILSLIALVVLSGFFSASETAYTSLNRVRVKSLANAGNRRAAKVLRLAERYDKLLSGILVGNNIVNILSASLATVLFVNLMGGQGVSVSTAVMTVLKEASVPRFAPLAGWMAAAKAKIEVLDEKAVDADPIRIGLKGSPTKVVTIFPPPVKGGGEKIDARGDGERGAKAIAAFLEKKGLVK